MNLISETRGFHDGRLALSREQVQKRRLVFRKYAWQAPNFLTHKLGDRASIEAVRLAWFACSTPTRGGPPRIDVVDGFALRYELLRETAAVAPGAPDAPLPLRPSREPSADQLG